MGSERRDDSPSTQLSILIGVVDQDPARAKANRERFVRVYGGPILHYLRRRWQLDEHAANDLSQDFLLEKVLGTSGQSKLVESYLARRSSDPGLKFRGYLFLSLRRYVIQKHRRASEATFDPQEAFDLQDESTKAEYREFEQDWARNLLERAIEEVRNDCLEKPGQRVIWEVLQAKVLLPALTGQPEERYETMYVRLGLESPKQAASRLQTAVRKFRDVLQQLVSEYLPGEGAKLREDLLEELADLRRIASTAQPLGVLESFLPQQDFDSITLTVSGAGSLFAVDQLNAEQLWREADHPGIWIHLLEQPVSQLLGKEEGDGARSRTLREALLEANTDLETLKKLKRAAKQLVSHAGRVGSVETGLDELPKSIYVTLYLATLAAARIHLNSILSKDSDLICRQRLDQLGAERWLDSETRSLFEEWRRRLG